MDQTLLSMARKAWPIYLLCGFFNLWNMMEINITTPFLYSRVQCCGLHGDLDSKYDIEEPSMIDAILKEAESLGLNMPVVHDKRISACAVPNFPQDSKMSSGSAECVNSNFVMDSSQNIISIYVPLQTIVIMLLLPVGGTIADACGRRPVLLTYGIMCMLSCVIIMLDSKYCHIWGNGMVFLAAALICSCWAPKDTVLVSSISDLTHGLTERNNAISLSYSCKEAGSLVGTLIAFIITSFHVSDYFSPWLAISCLAMGLVIFTQFFFTETLPKAQLTGLKIQMFNPFQTQLQALGLMWTNKLLLLLMAIVALSSVAFTGYVMQHFSYLTKHGFTRQDAILPTIVKQVVGIIVSCLVSRYGDCLHAVNRLILGCSLDVLGYLTIGPLFAVIGHVAPYLGFGIFLGSGEALIVPSCSALISAHVGAGDQAKCLSAVQCLSSIATLIGSIIYGNFLYDATATGLDEIRPVLASLTLSVVFTTFAVGMRHYECGDGQIRDIEAKLPLLSGPTSHDKETSFENSQTQDIEAKLPSFSGPTLYGTETSCENSQTQACKES